MPFLAADGENYLGDTRAYAASLVALFILSPAFFLRLDTRVFDHVYAYDVDKKKKKKKTVTSWY